MEWSVCHLFFPIPHWQVATVFGTVLRPFWAEVYTKLVTEEFKAKYPGVDWPEDALSLLPDPPVGREYAEELAMEGWVSLVRF